MIPLTRLRHSERFYLNPDLLERVDTHVDTVIRLTDGTEYIVVESGAEIARRVIEFRAQVLAVASLLQSGTVPTTESPVDTTADTGPDTDSEGAAGARAELNAVEEHLSSAWQPADGAVR